MRCHGEFADCNAAPNGACPQAACLAFLALLLISACFFAFFHLGRWLIAEDPLQNAAAIGS